MIPKVERDSGDGNISSKKKGRNGDEWDTVTLLHPRYNESESKETLPITEMKSYRLVISL